MYLNSVLSLNVQVITALIDQQDILREQKVRIDDLEEQIEHKVTFFMRSNNAP